MQLDGALTIRSFYLIRSGSAVDAQDPIEILVQRLLVRYAVSCLPRAAFANLASMRGFKGLLSLGLEMYRLIGRASIRASLVAPLM